MNRPISRAPLVRSARAWIPVLTLAACLAHARASAKELDQFTDRLLVLRYYGGGYRAIAGAPGPARVDAVLDARMDELLDELERELNHGDPSDTRADRDRIVRRVFQHRFLPELVTPYEEWVKHEAHVPLYKVRDKGIFGAAVDYDDVRMTWYIELSPIIQTAGVLIGLDKLGHFLAQGFQYYEHYRSLPELMSATARYSAIREYGHRQELGQLGIATGGVYSFADLASNWAGLMFFLALFDDVDVEGARHARYFERRADGTYRRVRPFHWAEWVTSDWDEVLNPAAVAKRTLFEKVSANLRRRPGPLTARRNGSCDDYRADPDAYLGPRGQLRARSRYAAPERAAAVAPYALDVRVICRDPEGAPAHPARPQRARTSER